MNFLGKTMVAALSLISVNAVANHANQFTYFGINLQNNKYDELDFAPQVDITALPSLTYDDTLSANGFRGFVGHQFNRYIALEAGLTSFAEASFTLIEEKTDADGKITKSTIEEGEFTTLGADIRAIATYPITDNVFVKVQVGVLAWDNDFSFLVEDTTGLTVLKESDSGVSLLTGAGLAYAFNDVVALSFDYEVTEIAEISTQSIALSLLMRF